MSFDINRLYKRVLDEAVDGLGLYLVKKGIEVLKPYTVKTLKQYNDPAIKIGLSMIDVFLPVVSAVPYVGDWLGLAGREGMKELIETLVDKPPTCFAEDSNTIHCLNFDTTTVTVKIDGEAVENFATEGTADDFKILLTTALSSGAHDLVVVGNKTAFSDKIYV